MQKRTFEIELGGKTLSADFTDLASQAHGSVILRYGETAILVTAVMSAKENPSLPYFPLSVEFEEKFYAVGAILGSRFQRREGRPSDGAVLSARIVDRTIRPLFNHQIRHDVQVVATVLAMGEDDPDVLAVIGASLALAVSDIPWDGPVGAIRIGRRKETGEVVLNPTYLDRAEDKLEFEVLACGKDGRINMIETAAYEVSEDDIVAILEACTVVHQKLEVWQKEIITAIGKEKRVVAKRELPEALTTLFTNDFQTKLSTTMFSNRAGKDHIHELKSEFLLTVASTLPEVNQSHASEYFEEMIDKELHRGVIEDKKRADGRGLDEVRELYGQAGGISPVLHGSGIFYRGATHIFTALTLGGPEAAQLLDTMEERETKKRFMHHYNFPPFSVGEAGRVGGQNRRMIGHGALAEKAIVPVLPPKEKFPYTIRLVSETMSSNGSSSMGSVCASSIALMDGGVPISKAVAGIASGLMMNEDKYVLLTDIQGPEDEHGDMDFKVAGTTDGITAIQMDVKVDGIPVKVLAEALEKAKQARLHIIQKLNATIASPRPDISPRAPKIITMKIDPTQIGLVIGSGGKTINGIKDDTGVEEISIEDDGTVYITGKNGTAEAAQARIAALTKIYNVGETLTVTITRLATFGAFAKMDDQNEGLIHISEIAPYRLENVEGILAVGEVVPVVVSKVEDGKIGLSIKKVDPDFLTKKGIKPPEKK
jgi:polyribonucleotide nucleotidyltransferase